MKATAPAEARRLTRTDRLAALWLRRRPVVMGVVNCTPDSFSDGGRYLGHARASRHAESIVEQGASIVDVGGESTRPGAEPVSATEELDRVLPVIRDLRARRPDVLISVDTCKLAVAEAALDAGADVINDVSAAGDPGMLQLAADRGAAVVLMHMRGTPRTMQHDTTYEHVVAEVHNFLADRAEAAAASGLDGDHIWLDPGIGFGKDDLGNLQLLASLADLSAMGFPVVVGPSRKSFIGRLTGAAVDDRLPGTLAALIPTVGVPRTVVRVHDVAEVVQFLEISERLAEIAS